MRRPICATYESLARRARHAVRRIHRRVSKFLLDVDRPNAPAFSFRDEDEQWLSLRYDLTAPLARYVAENQQFLPRPFRRYQIGTVFRNDKPGPGRYREFIQCDADTVGTASPSADAEMVMMFADTLEALGLRRGEYAIAHQPQALDGVLEAAGLPVTGSDEIRERRGIVLRAMDKLDRVGPAGVRDLLGKGRKDESGDFTKGAELDFGQAERIVSFIAPSAGANDLDGQLAIVAAAVEGSEAGKQGLEEVGAIMRLVTACGYDTQRVQLTPARARPRLLHWRRVRGAAHLPGAEREGPDRRVRLGRRRRAL